eukprot:43867-Eustigmatos_ZCMA.PRE.1
MSMLVVIVNICAMFNCGTALPGGRHPPHITGTAITLEEPLKWHMNLAKGQHGGSATPPHLVNRVLLTGSYDFHTVGSLHLHQIGHRCLHGRGDEHPGRQLHGARH